MISKRAFTLIELLVVISIISIVASIVYSATGEAKNRAKDAGARQNVESVRKALELYKDTNGEFPLASGASIGQIYSFGDPDNDYFEESMQILVDDGYLSDIVGSDGIPYTYGISSDGQSAVFGAGLNNSYEGSDSRNNCNISFENGGEDAGPEDPCHLIGRYPGNCDNPPPEWTGYVFPPVGHPEKTYCVNVFGSEDISYGCGCTNNTPYAVEDPWAAEWLTDSICADYFNPGTCTINLNFPPPNGSDIYACMPAEGESIEGLCNGSSDSDYCSCIN